MWPPGVHLAPGGLSIAAWGSPIGACPFSDSRWVDLGPPFSDSRSLHSRENNSDQALQPSYLLHAASRNIQWRRIVARPWLVNDCMFGDGSKKDQDANARRGRSYGIGCKILSNQEYTHPENAMGTLQASAAKQVHFRDGVVQWASPVRLLYDEGHVKALTPRSMPPSKRFHHELVEELIM